MLGERGRAARGSRLCRPDDKMRGSTNGGALTAAGWGEAWWGCRARIQVGDGGEGGAFVQGPLVGLPREGDVQGGAVAEVLDALLQVRHLARQALQLRHLALQLHHLTLQLHHLTLQLHHMLRQTLQLRRHRAHPGRRPSAGCGEGCKGRQGQSELAEKCVTVCIAVWDPGCSHPASLTCPGCDLQVVHLGVVKLLVARRRPCVLWMREVGAGTRQSVWRRETLPQPPRSSKRAATHSGGAGRC